jgi:predicted MPP superfamily phosphohydrolase
LLIIIDICFEVNCPKIEKSVLKSEKIHDKNLSLKILQISDVHGYFELDFISKAIKSYKPDIIVITGDLIDKRSMNYDQMIKFSEELAKLNPSVYFVSGNHEDWNVKGKEFVNNLRGKKINVIDNSNTYFIKESTKFNICGVNDYYSGLDDLNKAFDGIDEKNYTILLSHSPKIIDRIENIKADLILSGHEHGGQVRLPFIGALVAPGEGLFPKYSRGFYYFKDKVLYVDSGLGTSVLPIRFLDRSQISLIEIKVDSGFK